jgi:hypothetical protein
MRTTCLHVYVYLSLFTFRSGSRHASGLGSSLSGSLQPQFVQVEMDHGGEDDDPDEDDDQQFIVYTE